MADNDIGGMFGRALGNLKDSVVDGTKRKAEQTVDQKTREAQEAAKRKAMEKTGVTDQNVRDAQDPVGAAQRKAQQKLNEAERGVQGQVDKTTRQAEQGVMKGFNGGGSKPDAAAEAERLQKEAEAARQETLKNPRGPSELYLKEQAEQEALTRKLEAEKEERRKNPPGKSQAEIDAEAEQLKYMKPKAVPQSYDGAPGTPSGAMPISYDVGSQSKGNLSGDYEKALGLNKDEPVAVPSAKPGNPFKI